MSILIKAVRVSGFRGLKNIEVTLEKTTILTGMNNTGKTSLLKALQLALGNRQFISQDDFYIQGDVECDKIVVDLLIVPTDDDKQSENFSEDWEDIFTTDRIRINDTGNAFVPLRTVINFDEITNSYKSQQFILQNWPDFKQEDVNWFDIHNGRETSFYFDEVPFFYMDAQRDILDDTKLRSSYLGKMLSKIKYTKKDIEDIEEQIKLLNEKAVNSSAILSTIKTTLEALDTAMDTRSEGIEITPFTKKIRDLNKGLAIYYTDSQESFSMEYHGMGTRSWSSLLTLKAFIAWLSSNARSAFFPVLAIEEPEAHLHPNAQKKLYGQINAIAGQKIIATHSPYIAAEAKLNQVRNFYKDENITCGRINTEDLKPEDIRKITRQVIHTRGEIFFSKLIVFFEGETEEQAFPIFAQKHFDKTPVELGVDFVGVGGCGNYLPFLRFAESLQIPWLIFSDAENAEYDVKASVRQQFSDCGSTKKESDSIVFVDDGNDFERQLIDDGFCDEIRQAIVDIADCHSDQHRQKKVKEVESYDADELYKTIIRKKTQYSPVIAMKITESYKLNKHAFEMLAQKGISEDILDKLKTLENKQYSGEESDNDFVRDLESTIGVEQTDRHKFLILKHTNLPPKVIDLFDKITALLKIQETGS
jgi:putative ATP-dependent endonuclease of OLD family